MSLFRAGSVVAAWWVRAARAVQCLSGLATVSQKHRGRFSGGVRRIAGAVDEKPGLRELAENATADLPPRSDAARIAGSSCPGETTPAYGVGKRLGGSPGMSSTSSVCRKAPTAGGATA